MTRHFGVLIPSTNTTVEIECRLLPMTYQAHVGRLKSGGGSFSPSRFITFEPFMDALAPVVAKVAGT